METFRYTAKHLLTEKIIRGELEGENTEVVKKLLASQYLYPISIKKKVKKSKGDLFKKENVKLADLNFFCRQFAAMIEAGISINQALELCAQQSSSKVLRKHLLHIHSEVSEGKNFSKALEEEKLFPALLIHMVICGEVSGNLAEVMRRTAGHFEGHLGLRKKVTKALIYPGIVLCVVAIVVLILMIKVVPSYITLLSDTGAAIPLPTQIILNLSKFLTTYWRMLFACGFLIGIGFNYLRKLPSVKRYLQTAGLKIPLLGGLKKKSLSADFAGTLSMLVDSGIPMLQAMEITKNIMGHAVAEKEMDHAIEVLKSGKSLYEAINESRIFSPLLLNMVKIGEEAGTLDEMLVQMSHFFKEQVESTVDYLTVLIEPALIIIVSLIVGGIMAAIMLPTFSAATSVM